jgi:biotin-(acetyl-CoA carboxylase) ligase
MIYLEKIEHYLFYNLSEFEELGITAFHDYYKKYDLLADKVIRIINPNETIAGKYVDIAVDGGLIVKLPDQTYQTIYSGTIVM